MKKLIVLIFMLLPLGVFAQDKIAIVNTADIFNIMPEEMQKKQQELYAPIQQKMQDAIKAVGDEKGYTYILNPQVLLYKGNDAVDATDFVKAKLGIK